MKTIKRRNFLKIFAFIGVFGSLFGEAAYALDQGRDLFVHVAGLTGPVGAGSKDLADDGAQIIDGPRGIFEEWGVPMPTGITSRVARQEGADLTANGSDAGRHLAGELRRVLVAESSDE